MAKRIAITVVGLLLLIGALAGTKISQFQAMSAQAKDMKPPAMVVAVGTVQKQSWQSTLDAVGTVTPVRGVTLQAEAAGVVKKIFFDSGASVKAGEVLLQLDALTEAARLQAAEAAAVLGRSRVARVQSLEGSAAVAAADADSARAESAQAGAQVAQLRSEIGKRTLRAPFSGTLGIWELNLGRFLNVGDRINTLIDLQSVYVDFTLPQQQLSNVREGLVVEVTSDAFPKRIFAGTLTAIDPALDAATRSVKLRATLDNTDKTLRPGMFVNVSVVLPELRKVLATPQTAVLFAPYGDSVFVADKKDGQYVARQQFVRLGSTRGDFVEIEKGLNEGDSIVITGAFKLRNGMGLTINNELAPKTSTKPSPADE